MYDLYIRNRNTCCFVFLSPPWEISDYSTTCNVTVGRIGVLLMVTLVLVVSCLQYNNYINKCIINNNYRFNLYNVYNLTLPILLSFVDQFNSCNSYFIFSLGPMFVFSFSFGSSENDRYC